MPSLEFRRVLDRKSTRLNSSHGSISYAVFCLKKKIKQGRLPAPAHRRHQPGGRRAVAHSSPHARSPVRARPVLHTHSSFFFFHYFFLMIRRPPRSTLFPYRPSFC